MKSLHLLMWLLMCFINSSLEARILRHSPHWKVFFGTGTFFSTVIMEESLLRGSGRSGVDWGATLFVVLGFFKIGSSSVSLGCNLDILENLLFGIKSSLMALC